MEPQIWMTGKLVSEPVRKVAANGSVFTRLRLASDHRRLDRERGEWVDGPPLFITVVCWGRSADNVAQSLKTGDSVVVLGRLTMREWDDAAGGPRRRQYEIDAHTIGPNLGRYVVWLARPTRELTEVTGERGGAAGGSGPQPPTDRPVADGEAPAA
jgi:single-strand DNA-binding protein